MNFEFSPVGLMIQSDELIFFRGVETTNQSIFVWTATNAYCEICEPSNRYRVVVSTWMHSISLATKPGQT